MIDWIKVIELFLGLSLCGWVALIYGVLRDLWFRRKLERETEQAEALIVRYKVKTVSDGRYRTRKGYFPLLRFPVNGAEAEIQSREELKPEEHPEGSMVRLWFDPYEPKHLHMTEDDGELGGGMKRIGKFFILGAAVLSVIIGVFAFRR